MGLSADFRGQDPPIPARGNAADEYAGRLHGLLTSSLTCWVNVAGFVPELRRRAFRRVQAYAHYKLRQN